MHKPIDERLNGVKTEKEIEVDVVSLKLFFDEFDWNRFEAIEFLKNSRAYNELNDDNLIPDLPTNKNVTLSSDKKYLSIDLIE